MDDRLSRLLRLCELDRGVLEELRSLYNSLWNGFLTLKFRRTVNPVVMRHFRYLTDVDCDNPQNDCVQRACEFFIEICEAVRDGYDAEIEAARGDSDSRKLVTLEDEKLSDLSVLQVKYEKEPHELVRLMQACLSEEEGLLARGTAAATAATFDPASIESLGGLSAAASRKRSPTEDSDLLDEALATNRKLRRLAVEPLRPEPQSLELELSTQCRALLDRLDCRESIINSASCGRDSDLLSREFSCVLDSVSRLYQSRPLPELSEMAGQLLAKSVLILSQDDQVIKQRKSNYCLTVRCLAGEFLEPDRLYEFKVGVLDVDCEGAGCEADDAQSTPGRAVRHCSDLGSRIELRFGFPKLPASRSRRGRNSVDVCAQKRALEVHAQLAAPRLGHVTVRASARSLPVVFVTHDQQKSSAYATVCYDELFCANASSPRLSFDVPASVPVTSSLLMFDSLARRQLAQPLLPMQLDYFRRKLTALIGSDSAEVALDQLIKFKMADLQSRSLWEFYYQSVRLIKQRCLGLWGDRLLVGFLEKIEAERLVRADGRPGAFLIRVSETTGRLSVTRCRGRAQAESLDPFTDAELQATALADRLMNDSGLAWLITADSRSLAKSAALASHVTLAQPPATSPAADGYVPRRRRLRTDEGDDMNDCAIIDFSGQSDCLPNF